MDGTFVITDNRDAPDEDDDDFLDPVSGHGTFIATLIARLAHAATVEVGRVLDTTGLGNDADLSWRIGELCTEHPIDILCLSLSCYTDDDEPPMGLAAAIAMIQATGTVVVASAGNDSDVSPGVSGGAARRHLRRCADEQRAGIVHQLRPVGARLRPRDGHRQPATTRASRSSTRSR